MPRRSVRSGIAIALLSALGLSGCLTSGTGAEHASVPGAQGCEVDLADFLPLPTAGNSTTRFPAAACNRDVVDIGSKEDVDVKIKEIDRKILSAMVPIERRQLEVNRRMLAKYPRCGTVDAKSMRGRFEAELYSYDAERRPIPEGTGCVVVPQPGPPESFERVNLHTELNTAIAVSERAVERQLSLRQVQPHVNGLVVGGFPWVLRPFYRAILHDAAAGFEPVASHVHSYSDGAAARTRIANAAVLVQRLRSHPLTLDGSVRSIRFPNPAAVLADREGPVDAKAITIAAILRKLVPEVDLLLLEVGSAYLLGVAIEPANGDLVFIDEGDRTRRSPQGYVLVDPWAEAPVGRTVHPSLAPVLADGILSWSEVSVIYDLRPMDHPVEPAKRVGRG